MAPTDNNPPPHTAADYYRFFLEGLSGLIEDARSARLEPATFDLLLQAQLVFRPEFQRRHSIVGIEAADAIAQTAGDLVGEPVPWHVLAALIDDALASEGDSEGVALLRRAEELWPWLPVG